MLGRIDRYTPRCLDRLEQARVRRVLARVSTLSRNEPGHEHIPPDSRSQTSSSSPVRRTFVAAFLDIDSKISASKSAGRTQRTKSAGNNPRFGQVYPPAASSCVTVRRSPDTTNAHGAVTLGTPITRMRIGFGSNRLNASPMPVTSAVSLCPATASNRSRGSPSGTVWFSRDAQGVVSSASCTLRPAGSRVPNSAHPRLRTLDHVSSLPRKKKKNADGARHHRERPAPGVGP